MTDTSLDSTGIRTARARRGGAAQNAQNTAPTPVSSDHKPSFLILFFVLSLILPIYFFLGSMRLSVYRVILLAMAIPLAVQWLSGRAGRLQSVDFWLIGHGLWILVALFVVHGTGRLQIGTILAIETIIPFLFARVYIRTPEDFAFFIKCVCWAILLMIPLAFAEAMTGRIILSEIMSKIAPVYPDLQNEMRLGMHRAQGPFEHPILFGVFCASCFSASILVWGQHLSGAGRTIRGLVVGTATFLSLSMGAYVSLMIQIALLLWDKILYSVQARWKILLLGFLAFYIFIDLASDRSPINVITSILTFRGGAAYNRILIWEYGTAEVMRHPIFGLGFNDWIRLPWMVASVDNFWLVIAMKFGLPALICVLVPYIVTIRRVAARDFSSDPVVASYRHAYIFGLVGFGLAICTVYIWNATYVFFIFFMGAGVWMWDYEPPKASDAAPEGEGEDGTPQDDTPKYQSARTRQPRKGASIRHTKRQRPGPSRRPPRPSRK